VAPWLPYPAFLPFAFVGGLLGLPVYSVIRQALAAMVPSEQRRTAYAVDAMSVEVSYMIGPAVGSVIAIAFSTTVAMVLVGACMVAAGLALWLLNPPMRSQETDGGEQQVPLRRWFGRPLAAVLVATMATTVILYGSDLGLVAILQQAGEASWIGLVVAIWCLASLVGGFLYGAARRSRSVFGLVALLGITSIPVGLAVHWWWLAPAFVVTGLLCAPALTASAETVVGLAPEPARGVATGLQGSALTVGAAVGAPLAGAVIDAASPAAAFLVTGLLGAGLAVAAGVFAGRGRSERIPVGHTGQ
jgi:predicted MFS family arabinose efflux permease